MSDASGMIATQPIGFELARDDRIVGRVDHDLESIFHQGLSGMQGFADIGKERFRVAQHLELDQRVAVEQLARELQRPDSVVGAVAAGRIGQHREHICRQVVEQRRLAGCLADIGPANRDGDDLRPRGVDRGARLREVAVLAGTHQQARAVGAARDDQRIG